MAEHYLLLNHRHHWCIRLQACTEVVETVDKHRPLRPNLEGPFILECYQCCFRLFYLDPTPVRYLEFTNVFKAKDWGVRSLLYWNTVSLVPRSWVRRLIEPLVLAFHQYSDSTTFSVSSTARTFHTTLVFPRFGQCQKWLRAFWLCACRFRQSSSRVSRIRIFSLGVGHRFFDSPRLEGLLLPRVSYIYWMISATQKQRLIEPRICHFNISKFNHRKDARARTIDEIRLSWEAPCSRDWILSRRRCQPSQGGYLPLDVVMILDWPILLPRISSLFIGKTFIDQVELCFVNVLPALRPDNRLKCQLTSFCLQVYSAFRGARGQ